MDGGLTFFAVLIVKLGAALSVSTGVITGIKYFNTYEFKGSKKGGMKNESDHLEYLREKVRPKN